MNVVFDEGSWRKWAEKSKLGEVCGVLNCIEKPVNKCSHCGNMYCKRHSYLKDLHEMRVHEEIQENERNTRKQ